MFALLSFFVRIDLIQLQGQHINFFFEMCRDGAADRVNFNAHGVGIVDWLLLHTPRRMFKGLRSKILYLKRLRNEEEGRREREGREEKRESKSQ